MRQTEADTTTTNEAPNETPETPAVEQLDLPELGDLGRKILAEAMRLSKIELRRRNGQFSGLDVHETGPESLS